MLDLDSTFPLKKFNFKFFALEMDYNEPRGTEKSAVLCQQKGLDINPPKFIVSLKRKLQIISKN